MPLSPTQLTLRHLREDPRFTRIEVVERWNPHARIRQDLFGVVDVLAIGPGITLAVQCTSAGGVSARKRKLSEADATRDLLRAGWLVEIHGWAKRSHKWELTRYYRFELDEQQE